MVHEISISSLYDFEQKVGELAVVTGLSKS